MGRILRKPVWLLLRLFRKLVTALEIVHRQLPNAARLLRAQHQDRVQTAARYYLSLRDTVLGLPYQPKFSVIVPVYKVKPIYFREALLSVAQQVYPNWELCLVDDCSNDPELAAIIAEFIAAYPGQVKSGVNERNSHISFTSNACLALATGDYVTLLDHDDRLYPNALAEIARAINLHDQPDILYSDECTVDSNGNRISLIYHKPDWSPLLHLSMNYTTHLTTYRRKLVKEVGGFRVGLEGSQDHDLMLRMVEVSKKPVVHIPFCLYQWRAHENSTAKTSSAKPYAAVAGEKAVMEHLQRRGRAATVEYNEDTLTYRVTFALPEPKPLISIVIPSKDSPELIGRCLRSLLAHTTYAPYEIIIADNGTTDTKTLEFYREMEAKLGGRFRLLLRPRPFNFGAQVNDGVRAATGTYVVLLNNDTEVEEPRWLEEMLSLAQLPEVGPVGAKLFYKHRIIQHAGIVLSTDRIAEHLGLGFPGNHLLYWNVLNTVHETMAVTAACLMISREKYWEVGGLNETFLPRAYGDVEFCLALRDKGYVSVITPFATLKHHESATRGKAVEYFERFYLLTRRGRELAADPYVNLNLRRGPMFLEDPFYLDLDLNKDEFAHFLYTPLAEWRS